MTYSRYTQFCFKNIYLYIYVHLSKLVQFICKTIHIYICTDIHILFNIETIRHFVLNTYMCRDEALNLIGYKMHCYGAAKSLSFISLRESEKKTQTQEKRRNFPAAAVTEKSLKLLGSLKKLRQQNTCEDYYIAVYKYLSICIYISTLLCMANFQFSATKYFVQF